MSYKLVNINITSLLKEVILKHFTDQKAKNRFWSVKYTLFEINYLWFFRWLAINPIYLQSEFQRKISIFQWDITKLVIFRAFLFWSVKYPKWHLKIATLIFWIFLRPNIINPSRKCFYQKNRTGLFFLSCILPFTNRPTAPILLFVNFL